MEEAKMILRKFCFLGDPIYVGHQIKSANDLENNCVYCLARNGIYFCSRYFMEVKPFKGHADQDTWVPTEAPSACFPNTDLYATDRYKLFRMCEKQGLQIYEQVGEENA